MWLLDSAYAGMNRMYRQWEATIDDTTAHEPWQWPEAHWRRLVNQVRAGRTLRPKAWKDGARCAVALSFDVDHETNELRDGGQSIGRMAWGQFGNRVGLILGFQRHSDVRWLENLGQSHVLRLQARLNARPRESRASAKEETKIVSSRRDSIK